MAEQGVAVSIEARPPWLPSGVEPERYHKQMLQSISAYKRVSVQDIDKDGLERYLGVCTAIFSSTGLTMQPPNATLDGGLSTLILLVDCCMVESQLTGTFFSSGEQTIPVDGFVWKKAEQYLRIFDPIAVRYAGKVWNRLVQILYRSASNAGRVRFPHSAHGD
jgi:hypothetical protein